MLRKTHEALAPAWWIGCATVADFVAYEASQRLGDPVLLIGPVAVAAGAFLAIPTSAGKNSPDMDHRWAPGPPRDNYNWRFHRGWTHRVWFATVLTIVSAIVYTGVVIATGGIHAINPLIDPRPAIFAPVGGWWSHLAGDCIYGRILFGIPCRRYNGRGGYRWSWWHYRIGLGWETGGLSETGRSKTSGVIRIFGFRLIPADPASKVCLSLVPALAVAYLYFLGTVVG
jgi:hypothetical protein